MHWIAELDKIEKDLKKIKVLKGEAHDIGEFIEAEREIKDLENKKTKLTNENLPF